MPFKVSRKRGESNFVIAFWRAYERDMLMPTTSESYLYSRELQIVGFGIADLGCVTWEDRPLSSAKTDLFRRRSRKLQNVFIQAFEMKISGWKKGFAQACRYRFFAHKSFLVLPADQAELATKRVDMFEQTGIGLLAFDVKSGTIERLFVPPKAEPKSTRAYRIALERSSA